jgi:hypothetical protein
LQREFLVTVAGPRSEAGGSPIAAWAQAVFSHDKLKMRPGKMKEEKTPDIVTAIPLHPSALIDHAEAH